MKKILMAAVALICMTMTSVVFTSCKSEKTLVVPVTEQVFYMLKGIDNLQYYQAYKSEADAFTIEMNAVTQSVSEQDLTEEQVIARIQAVVDRYNNKAIFGTFELHSSKDGSTWKKLKTFTMTADPNLNTSNY